MALVHHVSFRRRFLVDAVIRTIASFTRDLALIEFVPDNDEHVAAWRLAPLENYNVEGFRMVLSRYFRSVEDFALEPAPRRLFVCKGRQT
jgi:hypothetical protein